MHNVTDPVFAEGGAAVARKFLETIDGGDAVTFWKLLDNRGKGYFLGMWFYALGNTELGTIATLAEDENFLKDALTQIIGDLRTNLEVLLEDPVLGELQYTDSHHAVVPVTAGEREMTDYIPLVLELCISEESGGEKGPAESLGMTCWKIDTLKCFQVRKV